MSGETRLKQIKVVLESRAHVRRLVEHSLMVRLLLFMGFWFGCDHVKVRTL